MRNDVFISTNAKRYSLKTDFGGYILRGGANDLLEFPDSKDVRTTSYAEVEYDIADLSDIRLESKKIKLDLFFKGGENKYHELISLLKENVYLTYQFELFCMTRTLRFIEESSCKYADDAFIEATLTFSEDQPYAVSPASFPTPYEGVTAKGGFSYSLDGVAFTEYGIVMLKGTHEQFLKLLSVKEGLSYDYSTLDGKYHDDGAFRMPESKDLTMHCFMRAVDMQTAVDNLNALLYQLTYKESIRGIDACKRYVTSDYLGQSFNCYYKSMKVTKFFPDEGRIWIEFDLTMRIVN